MQSVAEEMSMSSSAEKANFGSSKRKQRSRHDRRHRTGSNQPQPRPVRYSRSAGGVAYRRLAGNDGKQIQIALIATSRGTRWQLPKGRIEPGETSLEAAIREVEEETGLRTAHEAFLKSIEYDYQDTYGKPVPELVHKTVDFYLLQVVGGRLNGNSFEVDGVAWQTPKEALARLTFDGEQAVVELAQEHWT